MSVATVTKNGPATGVYLPAASDSANAFVQSSVTYEPPPVTYITSLQVTPSTANTPSQIFLSTVIDSSYPWTEQQALGAPIAYFAVAPLSG